MAAVAAEGHAGGGDGLDGGHAVALDAGDLDQAADGVAGQAEVVLDADLGGVLDLFGGPAEDLGEAARGHRAGGADLALAADLGAGDGGVLLEEHADRAGREQEADDAVLVRARDEVQVVVQDGRDDAGRAVGGRGDDPAAGGVLLVDGHRVEGDPLHRVAGPDALGPQGPRGGRGPAAHLQPARQDALAGHAGRDALLHDVPDLQQSGPDLGLGAPGLLVLQHQAGDGQAGLPGEAEQFLAGAEGVAQHGVVGLDPGLADRGLVDHEAAADGVVGLLQEHLAGRVVRPQRHAVGVVREGLAAVQDQIGVGVEGDLVAAEHVDPLGGADPVDVQVGLVDVDGARRVVLQAEQDGLGGAVAVAGGAEGAVQLGAERGDLVEESFGAEPAGEHPGGAHRADGVGGGRSDADGEEVEDADGHGVTSLSGLVEWSVRWDGGDAWNGAPRALSSVRGAPGVRAAAGCRRPRGRVTARGTAGAWRRARSPGP